LLKKKQARERARLIRRLGSDAEYLFDAEGPTWLATRRGEQIAPDGDWSFWLILAGRGWGKTKTGAEFIRDEVMSGRMRRVALVGRTAADVRDVMIEGPSGILAVCARMKFRALYEPSKRKITFENGAIALARSAEEPDGLRGPEWDGFWCDELAAWKSKKPGASAEARNLAQDTWDNLMFGFRKGKHPRGVVTTTPRPVALVKALLADARTVVTRGSTFDNAANLAKSFIQDIRNKYEGTRLGRQELYAEVLDDIEGALWTLALIDAARVHEVPRHEDGAKLPKLQRVVVALDPSTTHGSDSDETGIVVIGLGYDGDLYVMHAEGVRLSPNGWANRALDLCDIYGAGTIVYERNQGGEMVESTIRNAIAERQRKSKLGIPPRLKPVVATKGKQTRAEPVAALYEQGRVHHVTPRDRPNPLIPLEDQMVVFPVDPSAHDDLVDALVWGAHDLMPAAETGTLYVV
jgi:predicted phage terminase large subunit-like protein